MSIELKEIETWFFIEDGIKYLQYKYAYAKLLEYICYLRESPKRLHKDSDKQITYLLQNSVNKCQLWIAEMKNPEIAL